MQGKLREIVFIGRASPDENVVADPEKIFDLSSPQVLQGHRPQMRSAADATASARRPDAQCTKTGPGS